MHLDMRSHTAQRVSFIPTYRAPESLDTLVRVHVTLSSACRGTNRAADWTSPTAGGSAGTGMRTSGLDYSL